VIQPHAKGSATRAVDFQRTTTRIISRAGCPSSGMGGGHPEARYLAP
jgi:hypothetical protein